jgi:hypothetical protein
MSSTIDQRRFKNGDNTVPPAIAPSPSQNAAYIAALNANAQAAQQKSSSLSYLSSLGQIAQTSQGLWDKTDATKPFGARVAQLLKQNVPGLSTGLNAYKTVKNIASVASPEGLKTLAEKHLPEPLKPYAGLIQNPKDIYNMVKAPSVDAEGNALDVNAKAKLFAGKVIDKITPNLPYVKALPAEHQALLSQALKGDTAGLQSSLVGQARQVAEQHFAPQLAAAQELQSRVQSSRQALTQLQNTDPEGYLDKLNQHGLAQFPPDEATVLRRILGDNPNAQSVFQKAQAFHSIATDPSSALLPAERVNALRNAGVVDDDTHRQLLANVQAGQDLASPENAKLVTTSLTNHLLSDDNSPLKQLPNAQDLVNHPATQILLNHLSTGNSLAQATKQHLQEQLEQSIQDPQARAVVHAALNPEEALANLRNTNTDPNAVNVGAEIAKRINLPNELQEAAKGNLEPARQQAVQAASHYLKDSGVLGKTAAAQEHADNLQNLYQSATNLDDTPETRQALASASVRIGKGLLTEAATHLPESAVKPTQAGLGFVFDQAEKAANGEKPSSGLSFSSVGTAIKKEATRQAKSFSDELFGNEPATTKTSSKSTRVKANPNPGQPAVAPVNVPTPVEQQGPHLAEALRETLAGNAVDQPVDEPAPKEPAPKEQANVPPIAPEVNPNVERDPIDIPLPAPEPPKANVNEAPAEPVRVPEEQQPVNDLPPTVLGHRPQPANKPDTLDTPLQDVADQRLKHAYLSRLPPEEQERVLRQARQVAPPRPPPRDTSLYDLYDEFGDIPVEPAAKRAKQDLINPVNGEPISILGTTKGGSLKPPFESAYRSAGSVPVPRLAVVPPPPKQPQPPPQPQPQPQAEDPVVVPDETPTFAAANTVADGEPSISNAQYDINDQGDAAQQEVAVNDEVTAQATAAAKNQRQEVNPNPAPSTSTVNAAYTNASNANQRQQFDQTTAENEESATNQAAQAAANLKASGKFGGQPETNGGGGGKSDDEEDDDEDEDEEEGGSGLGLLATSEFDPVNAVLGAISLGSSIKSLLDDESTPPPPPDLPTASGTEYQDQGISGPSSPTLGAEGSFFSANAMAAQSQNLDPSADQSNLTNDLDAGL